jgi:hypothetical protein
MDDGPRRFRSVRRERMFRHPVVLGGGTPFLPPVAESVALDLTETRAFGSTVVYGRYRRRVEESDLRAESLPTIYYVTVVVCPR